MTLHNISSTPAGLPAAESAKEDDPCHLRGEPSSHWSHAAEEDDMDARNPGGETETQGDVHTSNTITYPEGGWRAWSVAIGSWCAMAAGMGVVNSVGMFQALVSTTILPSYSSQALGWIFGLYVFVSYVCSVLIGPIFDARGPRELLAVGTVCTLVGFLTLAQCTEYYQFVLAFSVLTGIGSSLLFTPAIGAISHWFHARRGTASGFAFTGSAFGGVLWPLMVQSLVPQVGWAWAMRAMALVLLVLCAVSIALCRSRLPPRKGGATSWRDMLPDPRIFLDGTGALAVTTAGVFLVEWAYFVPVAYVPSYYLAREGLAGSGDATAGGRAAFAYQLLAVINGVSCIGRYLPGYIADRVGRYNTLVVSTAICLASVACLWLPDALAGSESGGPGLLIAFAVLFGLVSGSNITLTPICIGQLCDTREYGRYYASAYTVTSFGCLTGIPIAGSLIDVGGTSSARGYWGAILFTIVSYVVALACFLWVRVRVKGCSWRTVW